MRLGILVVYFVSGNDDWVLHMHLQHLARTDPFMNFRVYAAANRLPKKYESMLRSHEFIEVVDVPLLAERGGEEHGTYLDLLAARAFSDGCDYICTFDVDSWPIRSDWIKRSYNKLVENRAVAAAILRAENGDTVLPHPSFSFFEAKLFEDRTCRFWVPRSELTAEYQNFLSTHRQLGDTGAGIGFYLENNGLRWVKMMRTNKVNYHFLLGGIYDDYIFHLGASSRKNLIFRKEGVRWIVNITMPMSLMPVLWRGRQHVIKALKLSYEPFVARRNRRAFNDIATQLRADEEAFYRRLLS